jgi:tRNA A-37 threonylcarbamoyl transferase component Bud32
MKQLEMLTDAGQMKAVLQQQLPAFRGGDLVIRQCEILHTRYRAYTSKKEKHKTWLGVCYRLAVETPDGEERSEQILYGRACVNGNSQSEFQEALASPLTPPRFGDALTHLPELDMTVWAFPNDPQLPHLPQVIDPQQLKQRLPYAGLPASFQQPEAIEPQVVHYYPEERCTTRYRLRAGGSQELTLYGKTYKNGGGRIIYERAAHLWRQSQTQPGGFKVAEPVAYDENVHTIWQKHQPGRPLIQLLEKDNCRELMAAVARGLARFHDNDLTSPARQTVDSHLSDIRDKFKKLVHAFPQFKAPLLSLIGDLESSAAGLTPFSERLIHGDFHIRQLLAHQGDIVVFDFDEFAMGDPAQDLANFIVALHFEGLSPEFAEAAGAAFYQAYQTEARPPVSPDRFRWHLRFCFMTKAYRRYRQKAPGLADQIQRAMALAQKAADLSWAT